MATLRDRSDGQKLNRLYLVFAGLVVIAMLSGWLGFAIAVQIYTPNEEELKRIVSAEYLREWSSYTNLPTIKPDDCTVRRTDADERGSTNVYFVGACQSNVDGKQATFDVMLNEMGRAEHFDMQP